VRKILVLLVGLLLVGGCSGSSDPTSTTDAAGDLALLGQVTVTNRPGASPKVTLPTTPFYVNDVTVRLVSDGDGAALTAGQELKIRMLAVSGTDGAVLEDSWDTPAYSGVVVGAEPLFDRVLTGAHIGAMVLAAVPDDNTTDVIVFEIVDVLPVQATGEPVAPVPGLPTVTVGDDGVPTGITASGQPPTSLVVQPLIAGDGPLTAAGQTVHVQYTGWLWDGTQFDSSWPRGRFSLQLGAGGVIEGWDEGLVGQAVGSRLLLVIPPDKGYRDQDNGTIPPNSTLVFVVDILGTS